VLALRSRNYDVAAQRFNGGARFSPTQSDRISTAGDLEGQRGFAEAMPICARRSKHSNNLGAAYALTRRIERQGDLPTAEAEFKEVMQDDSGAPEKQSGAAVLRATPGRAETWRCSNF